MIFYKILPATVLSAGLVLGGFMTAAEAGTRVERGQSGRAVTCPPRGCDPQRTSTDGSGDPINEPLLTIIDPASIDVGNLFITGVQGASSNPEDIVQLVDDAVAVWEKAFAPDSFPDVTFNVGWADFGIDSDFEVLDGDTASQNFPTAFFDSDNIGLHVCGAPFDPTAFAIDPDARAGGGNCNESALREATILFNSEILEVDSGAGLPLLADFVSEEDPTVKLFLDSDPFNSLFNDRDGLVDEQASIIEIGSNSFGPSLKDTYNYPLGVDLFTVALHEVGHALGFSTLNSEAELNPLTQEAHVDFGSVLTGSLEFNVRGCPTTNDVQAVLSSGSYAPGSGDYTFLSNTPCSDGPTRRPPIPGLDNRPDPESVPEPSLTLSLLLAGSFSLWSSKKNRAVKT